MENYGSIPIQITVAHSLDYILINKKWINSVLNCKAYFSFERVSSDHRIVLAKIRLSVRRNKKQSVETTRYYWSSLNNTPISNKYSVTVRNKFDTLQDISETPTPNDEYENYVTAHMEAAAEGIPTTPRATCRIPWELQGVRKKTKKNEKTGKSYPYLKKKLWKCQRAETLESPENELTHTKKNKKNIFKVRLIK